ncbi:MAG: hypothetical protein AAFO89_00545, partial [Planctomycetota bacterium]
CLAQGETQAEPPETHATIAVGPVAEVQRDIRKIFSQFFKRTRSEVSHRRGWEELQRFASDDRIYPLLIELFKRQPTAVRNDLTQFFAENAGVHAQTVVTWVAVFEDDDSHRAHANATLQGLVGNGEPSNGAQRVIAAGLKSGEDAPINRAAGLVQQFGLLRAVPLLAQAQAQPRNSGGTDVRTGALAQIVVGTQQAFVADLTPVVAANAVGFQPTIGVISSGTVLRVIDAVVYEYRTDVHQILVDMTTTASGEPTGHLGYDATAWRDWYARVLEPKLDAQDTGG